MARDRRRYESMSLCGAAGVAVYAVIADLTANRPRAHSADWTIMLTDEEGW
jgi:hypothetical protein